MCRNRSNLLDFFFKQIVHKFVKPYLLAVFFKNSTYSTNFYSSERAKRIYINYFYTLKVLTKDSVTVSVDAVVYYRVSNATVSVANVENAHHSTRLLAQTTLRNILGTKSLHEILSERDNISNSMQVRI